MAAKAAVTRSARSKCTWHTQYVLGGTRKRPDMVCITEDGKALIFEHKVEANLGHGQLEDYRRIAGQRFGEFAVVLVTMHASQCGQSPDCHVLWRDVYEWLSRWLLDVDEGKAAMALHFMYLLKERGPGPMELIETGQLGAIPMARMGLSRIRSLVYRVAEHFWPEAPVSDLKRVEGRLGFWLRGQVDPGTWKPGVFVGVMVDGNDHGPETVNSAIDGGPVACVVLDLHKGQEYEAIASYRCLEEWAYTQWLRNHPGWAVFRSRNRWHPMLAYKPFGALVGQATTGQGQISAFFDDVGPVVSALLACPAFEEFEQALQRNRPG